MIDVAVAVVAAVATLVGGIATVWVNGRSDKRSDKRLGQEHRRLEQEHKDELARLDQERKRLEQEHTDERARLRLDAAMRAGELFTSEGNESSRASNASGLLALTQLGHADLAVALLVDLWSRPARALSDTGPSSNAPPKAQVHEPHAQVSTETAILVLDAALRRTDSPSAQLVAAELLCRNAARLDPCQSLHWPPVLDGRWCPSLGPKAKLLAIDALVQMTLACDEEHQRQPNENALRSLVVRLYGIWDGDPDERVKGCVGVLIACILDGLHQLPYKEFLGGATAITLQQIEDAGASASKNPDGYLERMVADRGQKLHEWSLEAARHCLFSPGVLATAAHELSEGGGDAVSPLVGLPAEATSASRDYIR